MALQRKKRMRMRSRRVEAPNATMVVTGKFTDRVTVKPGTDGLDAAEVVVAALRMATVDVEPFKVDREEKATVVGTQVTTKDDQTKMVIKTDNTMDTKIDMAKTDTRIAEVMIATGITATATLAIVTSKMKTVVATDTTITRATKADLKAAAEEVRAEEHGERRGLLARNTPVNRKELNSLRGSQGCVAFAISPRHKCIIMTDKFIRGRQISPATTLCG